MEGVTLTAFLYGHETSGLGGLDAPHCRVGKLAALCLALRVSRLRESLFGVRRLWYLQARNTGVANSDDRFYFRYFSLSHLAARVQPGLRLLSRFRDLLKRHAVLHRVEFLLPTAGANLGELVTFL